MNDLWAEDIVTGTVNTPVAILREQASLLGKKTQNLVLAEVASSAGYQFKHRFKITAPALGDYAYTLFSIEHPIGLYPLKMDLDGELADELEWDDEEINDESKFIKFLDRILKAERTKQIIRTFLAQSSE